MKNNELFNILNKYDIKIKKKFGQNFLLDDNILSNIVKEGNVDEYDGIIEIGPGLGFLTEKLLKTSKPVLAYEIDTEMVSVLNDRFGEFSNFKIVLQDFLKTNPSMDIQNYFNSENICLIANLPYYITTPILTKVLEEVPQIKKMVVMMQHEVSLRVSAAPSKKDYNGLSVLVEYFTSRRIAFKVPPQSFYPVPLVDSSVVVLERKNTLLDVHSKQFFFDFLRNIFKQRRKTLANNMKSSYNITSEEINNLLTTLKMPLLVRADSLNLEQIVSLSNLLFEKIKA